MTLTDFGAAAAVAAAAGWRRPHGGVRCLPASLALSRLMVLTFSLGPGLVNVGADKRFCIIMRHVALRWDDPRRREVSYCFIANVGISGGSHRWVGMT